MRYGEPHRHLFECGSTNDYAVGWALDPDDPAPDGALVTASHQTKGRGRRGRSWDSGVDENILMSVVMRSEGTSEFVWQIAFVCALAVMDTLRELSIDSRIKWPNDILINGCKAAGVLVECPKDVQPTSWLAIAGIGINVNRTVFNDAETYPLPPTSLTLETGRAFDIPNLSGALIHSLERRELQRRNGGWGDITHDVRSRLAIGTAVRRGETCGVLHDIGSDGAAIVRLQEGTFERWRSVDEEVRPNSV